MAIDYPSLDKPTAGAIRFNTETSHMEIYDGNQWVNVRSGLVPNLQTAGTRGCFMSGYASPSDKDVIDYVNISTTGNAIDFGNETVSRRQAGACSSRIRGICAAGTPDIDTIDYITFAITGNAVDFGNLTSS